ncbi:CD3324 family protein [Petroclostridium sp. X23]|uniref:CD3324 family protein n=1 Tax=Petroclostridium sp. X23 TaxID=3045146 RepID=UPI0024ACF6CD|nr:CD3324 family protein [Petroclostridium sp. X23]WHH57744.1 CD3324 family protein [Petroclostridium sp. X23]
MSYLNGKSVLPKKLLVEIQEYIDGEYIYIPRKECNRQIWGTTNQSKRCTFDRNQEIFNKYMSGISVETLAEEYFLSVKTIYGIIAKMKR